MIDLRNLNLVTLLPKSWNVHHWSMGAYPFSRMPGGRPSSFSSRSLRSAQSPTSLGPRFRDLLVGETAAPALTGRAGECGGGKNLTRRGMRVTQPFDASTLLSIDPERCGRVDLAQDREPVEWQIGVVREPQEIGEWREKKWPLRIEGLGDGSGDFPRILRGLAPMRSEQVYFLPHCGILVKLFLGPVTIFRSWTKNRTPPEWRSGHAGGVERRLTPSRIHMTGSHAPKGT
jgi:hypothetical protein